MTIHNYGNHLPGVRITICEKVYLKDPDSTELGQRIISGSIKLIDKLGFEHFTFKKLAEEINSTEASVYRYFENKHKLLLYLALWYWNWLEYQLTIRITNVEEPECQLERVIELLSENIEIDPNFGHIDEVALQAIVVTESSKAYFNKHVKADNRDGYLESYKRVTGKVAQIIQAVQPKFEFPNALASTLIESSHNQIFFAEHLPHLSNLNENANSELYRFMHQLVFGALGVKRSTA